MLREEGENLELGQGEVHALAVDEHLVPAEVDLEAAELADGRAAAGAVELAAPQDRAHAAQSSALENGFVT